MVQPVLNCYGSAVPELTLERNREMSGVASEAIDGLDRIGVALADPIRRDVLVRLLDGSKCPSDLADVIGTSRSNLSNHLACLRGCGLIVAERVGRHLHYELVSEQLSDALRSLVHVASRLPECSDQRPPTAAAGSTRRGDA